MSAEILEIADYRNRVEQKRIAERQLANLQAQSVGLLEAIDAICTDAAPSEYVAPETDPA